MSAQATTAPSRRVRLTWDDGQIVESSWDDFLRSNRVDDDEHDALLAGDSVCFGGGDSPLVRAVVVPGIGVPCMCGRVDPEMAEGDDGLMRTVCCGCH